jgi:NAD(P)-dependent dehydrogenase (short-subunit alcohol dehydrogenase family)
MQIAGKIVVVTGAANGIGKALAERFSLEGAERVVCADLDAAGAQRVAAAIGGLGSGVDVAEERQVAALIEYVEREVGPIDLFCSNAGIVVEGGVDTADAVWEKIWKVNVMAHVFAARHLVPRMAARGGGYLLNTASAAGLLSQVGSAPYSVTKHAAVGLAEWLAFTHADQGIKVSVLCPQAVRTAMTADNPDGVAAIDGMIEPEAVAEACVRGIVAEQFLILPHPQVRDYMLVKAEDYGRWIGGMRKLNRRYRS